MVWKHQKEATSSEVEDEPGHWQDQVRKNTLDLRTLASFSSAAAGDAENPASQPGKKYESSSGNSTSLPKNGSKSKGKQVAQKKAPAKRKTKHEEDSSSEEEEEEAEQSKQPKKKRKAPAKSRTKNKASGHGESESESSGLFVSQDEQD